MGLTTAVGGGVALGLDGTEGRPAGPNQERQVYDTKSIGLGLLGAGLGVATLGATLLLVEGFGLGRERARRLRVDAAVTGKRVYVGLRGRF